MRPFHGFKQGLCNTAMYPFESAGGPALSLPGLQAARPVSQVTSGGKPGRDGNGGDWLQGSLPRSTLLGFSEALVWTAHAAAAAPGMKRKTKNIILLVTYTWLADASSEMLVLLVPTVQ